MIKKLSAFGSLFLVFSCSTPESTCEEFASDRDRHNACVSCIKTGITRHGEIVKHYSVINSSEIPSLRKGSRLSNIIDAPDTMKDPFYGFSHNLYLITNLCNDRQAYSYSAFTHDYRGYDHGELIRISDRDSSILFSLDGSGLTPEEWKAPDFTR